MALVLRMKLSSSLFWTVFHQCQSRWHCHDLTITLGHGARAEEQCRVPDFSTCLDSRLQRSHHQGGKPPRNGRRLSDVGNRLCKSKPPARHMIAC